MMIGHTQVMAGKRNPTRPGVTAEKRISLGPIGEAVRANVEKRRGDKNLGYAKLARKLEEIGRPIPELGLRRIEEGNRRVDVDDLVALAMVLETSPITLLMPVVDESTEMVPVTDKIKFSAAEAWLYLQTDYSGGSVVGLSPRAFFNATKPEWVKGRWIEEDKSDGNN
jgi:hypothetical protein